MQVSKPVVIAAIGAMVAMVGVIAFLLGRESGRHHASPPALVAGPAPAAAPSPPALMPQLTGAAPYAISPSAPPTTAAEAPPPASAPSRPAPRPLSNQLDEAAQVHAYFLRITEIQAGPSGDPGEVSNKLIASLMNGDSSGFDSLIDDAKSMLASAQAVTPPAACAEYHQKLVKLLGDSLAMLQQLEPAIKRGDAAAATAILPAANALQSQTTALESQGRELKARYGIRTLAARSEGELERGLERQPLGPRVATILERPEVTVVAKIEARERVVHADGDADVAVARA